MQKLNILVVEDNMNKYRNMESALEKCGEDLITHKRSRNGALKALLDANKRNNQMYDLVILDMQLPLFEVDGPQDILKNGGATIESEIVRKGYDCLVAFYTSEDLEQYYYDEDDYVAHIKYDPSVSIDEDVKQMIDKVRLEKEK